MHINLPLSAYVIPIIIGISIVSATAFAYYQLITYENQLVDNSKREFTEIIKSMIERRESRIETIGSSIIAFYEGSQSVEKNEFVIFSKKILENNQEILNIFTLKNNYVIQSYPHDEFLNKHIDEILQGFPLQIDGINSLAAEFFMSDNMSVIVIVPFNYLVIEEEILHDNYKLILTSPLANNTRLYEIEKKIGNEFHSGITLSPDEIKDSITIQRSTNLYGHVLKQNHDLKYTVWDDSFVTRKGPTEIITFVGFIMAIIIPLLLIHSSVLRNELHLKSTQLEKANQEIMQVEKTKEEFSAMVTHELKTPLVPILGYCSMLRTLMLGNLNEEQANAIDIIEKNAKRLEELISDIMDARKLDIDKMRFRTERLSLNEFFDNLDLNYKKILKDKGIEFLTKLSSKDLAIFADKTRLRQVFDNLISNSIKFVSKNGLIEVGGYKEKDDLTLYVKDNGMGIPKDKQSDLFKKFYQVDTSMKRAGGGTGLGLAISKGIIEKLGGTMWVESDGKTGTTFYLKLPFV